MDNIAAIQALYPKSGQFLLWKIFLRHKKGGLQLWLAAGFGISQMPDALFFYGHDAGLFRNEFIQERMKHARNDFLFLPELIEAGQPVDAKYSKVCSEQFLRAVRIIRSSNILKEDRIWELRYRDERLFSQEIRMLAAILIDDTKWVDAIASEPEFSFSTKQLSFAARHGSIECFRFISINRTRYDQSVIEGAVYGGNEEIIQMCLEHECNLKTPQVMTESICGCQTAVVEWLTQIHDMKPTIDDFIYALMNGHCEFLVHSDMDQVASISITFKDWEDIIHPRNDDCRIFARHLLTDPSVPCNFKDAFIGNSEFIVYCDDIELASSCGTQLRALSILKFAAKHRCDRVMNELSSNGVIRQFGERACYVFADDGDFNSIVSFVTYVANVNHTTLLETGLVRAARRGFADIVEYLVGHGVNVNARQDGKPVLMLAIENYQLDVARVLAEHGADVNAVRPSNKMSMLMHAADCGHTDIVKLLVDNGANMDLGNADNTTPLMRAASCGFEAIAKYLVEHGANLDAIDNNGWTALGRASCSGHSRIVNLLIANGANSNPSS